MGRYSGKNSLCSFYISLIIGVSIWLAKDTGMSRGAKIGAGIGILLGFPLCCLFTIGCFAGMIGRSRRNNSSSTTTATTTVTMGSVPAGAVIVSQPTTMALQPLAVAVPTAVTLEMDPTNAAAKPYMQPPPGMPAPAGYGQEPMAMAPPPTMPVPIPQQPAPQSQTAPVPAGVVPCFGTDVSTMVNAARAGDKGTFLQAINTYRSFYAADQHKAFNYSLPNDCIPQLTAALQETRARHPELWASAEVTEAYKGLVIEMKKALTRQAA